MCHHDNMLFTGSAYAKDIYLYTRKAINPEVLASVLGDMCTMVETRVTI